MSIFYEESSYTKNWYKLLVTNLMLNTFMLNNFFEKLVFSEKTEKTVSGGTDFEELK